MSNGSQCEGSGAQLLPKLIVINTCDMSGIKIHTKKYSRKLSHGDVASTHKHTVIHVKKSLEVYS